MIGLHQQGVAARQLRFDMLAGVSQVGQNAQVHCAIGASQLQWLAGIVRYGEGSGLPAAQVDGLQVVSNAQQPVEVRGAQGGMCAVAHPDGDAMLQCDRPRAADVI